MKRSSKEKPHQKLTGKRRERTSDSRSVEQHVGAAAETVFKSFEQLAKLEIIKNYWYEKKKINEGDTTLAVGAYFCSWLKKTPPNNREARVLSEYLNSTAFKQPNQQLSNAIVQSLLGNIQTAWMSTNSTSSASSTIMSSTTAGSGHDNSSSNGDSSRPGTICDISQLTLFGCSGIVGFDVQTKRADGRNVSFSMNPFDEEDVGSCSDGKSRVSDSSSASSSSAQSSLQAAQKLAGGGFIPSPHCSHFLTEWDKNKSSLLILGGSSGSGKSVTGVHLGKLWRQVAGRQHAQDTTKHKITKEMISTSENIVFYFTSSKLASWDETDPTMLNNKDVRDAAVKNAINQVVTELFKEANVRCQPLLQPAGQNKRPNVVFVIDELGGMPIFVRGLASSAASLAKSLHHKFFGEEGGFNTRVAFIAIGTGLAVKGTSDGSSNETFSSFLLDNFPLTLDHMFQNFGLVDLLFGESPSARNEDVPPSSLQRLALMKNLVARLRYPIASDSVGESLSTSSKQLQRFVPALEPIELTSRDLLLNPRCAALFCWKLLSSIMANHGDRSLRHHSDLKTEFNLARDHWMQNELPQIISKVINKFISLNGLSGFHHPLKVLLCSLAVVVFRLPTLPVAVPASLSRSLDLLSSPAAASSSTTRINPPKLHSMLSTWSGILVDQSCTKEMQNQEKSQVDAIHLSMKGRGGDDLLFPSTGRFFMSSSSLAKIHFFLGINRRPFNESGLELSIADFCFCVASCAPYYKSLKESLVCGRDKIFKSETEMERYMMKDPMYCLKKELVFIQSPATDETEEDNTEESTLLSRSKFSIKYFQNEQQLAKKTNQKSDSFRWSDLRNEMKGVKEGRTAVVMRTAHQEPFADVIVAGRNKLILIQVKSNQTDISDSDKVLEFAKMTFGQHQVVDRSSGKILKTYPTPCQEQLFQELIENCRSAPAAEVKVSAFIITSSAADGQEGFSTFTKVNIDRSKDKEEKLVRSAMIIRFKARVLPSPSDTSGVPEAAIKNQPSLQHYDHPLFPAHPNRSVSYEELAPRLLAQIDDVEV